MKVTRKKRFDVAHHLPGHKGKCANVHGHTITVEVSYQGSIEPGSNKLEDHMVVDYGTIDHYLGKIVDNLDHSDLNSVMDFPTSEELIRYFEKRLPKTLEGAKLRKVKIHETPNSYAEKVFE